VRTVEACFSSVVTTRLWRTRCLRGSPSAYRNDHQSARNHLDSVFARVFHEIILNMRNKAETARPS